MRRRVVATGAPTAGPYSPAVRAGGLVFVSGQVGFSASEGRLREGLRDQLRQALQNAASVLQGAGCSLADTVKVTLFLCDLSQFSVVNEVFAEFFPEEPPARTTVQVSSLPLGAEVEVDLVAATPSDGEAGG